MFSFNWVNTLIIQLDKQTIVSHINEPECNFIHSMDQTTTQQIGLQK